VYVTDEYSGCALALVRLQGGSPRSGSDGSWSAIYFPPASRADTR